MRATRRLAISSIAALAVVAGTGAVSNQAFANGGKPRPDTVVVRGDVQHKLKLTAAELAALPQQSIIVTYKSGSTSETHTFTGPLLLDVLNAAVPEFDPAVKNDKLGHFVDVTGSDGYEAVVAWGEFDPDFEGKQLLIAITQDGVALGDAGPRLVVPGDSRGGRYVGDVVTIRLAPNH